MSTPTPPLPDHDREEWRDFLLQEVVTYLGEHKEEIIGRYQEQSRGRLSRDQIEAQGLHNGSMHSDPSDAAWSASGDRFGSRRYCPRRLWPRG